MSWLYDDEGEVRRELYTQGEAEILQRAAEIDEKWASRKIPLWAHQCFIDPTKWAISKGTDGWLNIIRFDLHAQKVFVLAHGPTGGGFIGLDMITDWRTLDARQPKPAFYASASGVCLTVDDLLTKLNAVPRDNCHHMESATIVREWANDLIAFYKAPAAR